MSKFAAFIDRYKKVIIIAFLATSLVGVFLFLLTPVNYNMMDYLPQEANSTRALTVMEEEFDQPLPNLNVMVENVSLTQALEIKAQIAAANHVKEVLWLDDTVNLKTPLETQATVTSPSFQRERGVQRMSCSLCAAALSRSPNAAARLSPLPHCRAQSAFSRISLSAAQTSALTYTGSSPQKAVQLQLPPPSVRKPHVS